MTQPEPATVAVDAASVVAGSSVTVSGTGFAADAALKIELRSTPVQVGTATADAAGAFRAAVTIPADTTAGAHSIVVIDSAGVETSVALAVTAAPVVEQPGTGDSDGTTGGGGTSPSTGTGTGNLATTGADSQPFIFAALLLLGAGAVLSVIRRRRMG